MRLTSSQSSKQLYLLNGLVPQRDRLVVRIDHCGQMDTVLNGHAETLYVTPLNIFLETPSFYAIE